MALEKVKFNNTEIPWTNGWEVAPRDILNENQSEGGTDIVQAIRRDKLSISVQTTCLSAQLKIYAQFKKLDSFTLSCYDPITEENEEHTVRIANFRYSKKPKTERLEVTNGIYNVSFTIEEF